MMQTTKPDDPSASLLLDEAFHQAASHHQAGQLKEAEALYRAILEIEPGHPDANYNLGLLAMQLCQPATGASCFKAALEARPDQEAFWIAYIDALLQSGEDAAAGQVLALGVEHGLSQKVAEELASRLKKAPPSSPSSRSPAKTVPHGKTSKGQNPQQEAIKIAALFQQGLHGEAEALARGLTKRFPRFGLGWKLLGAALLDQGHASEALAPLKKAVALLPADAQARSNLGNAWRVAGRLDQASACYRQALKVDPACSEAHNNLGLVLRDLGEVDAAMASYRRAIEIRPDYAMAHNNLGAALLDLGHLDASIISFQRALKIKPDFGMALDNLALAYKIQGRTMEAFNVICRSLRINETPNARQIFVDCIRYVQLKLVGDDLRAFIARALLEPWGRPNEIASTAIRLVKFNPEIRERLARVTAAWPQRLALQELAGAAGLEKVAADSLLCALLDSTLVCDIELERFLTATRHALLEMAANPPTASCESDVILNFGGVLARQCFINEYVFAWTEDEARRASSLRDSLLAALDADAPIPALQVAIVAAYFPLYRLPHVNRLLSRAWPEAVNAILVQQIREPAEEADLLSSIPHLTDIADEVSQLVRNQYEENPYPRWVRTAPAARATTIDAEIRQNFPLSPFRPLDKGSDIDILIAGCGTGQQPIERAQRYPGAHMLAVDLSLASLSYAKRKSRALGLNAIEYAQADILGMGNLDRRFDVIMSSGVLHHLADPLAGWRTLLSLLRPGGLMFLGFYSEIARRNIVRARSFIAAQGYAASPEDIRRCRQDLIEFDAGGELGTTLKSHDFFSTSACRDLLFHVQEHRMTLGGIADFLRGNGLQFLGFSLEANAIQAYRQRFPNDPAAVDLVQWQLFENDNPDTFFGMYQFWVQKTT